MRDKAFKELLDTVNAKGCRFAEWASNAGPADTIDVAALRAKIEAEGLTVVEEPAKHGHWFRVYEDGGLVAQGYSQTPEDAALYAVLGAIREGK